MLAWGVLVAACGGDPGPEGLGGPDGDAEAPDGEADAPDASTDDASAEDASAEDASADAPSLGCRIDGATVSAGTIDPADPCKACDPAISTSAWSVRADGAACGAGTVCANGACSALCFIGGELLAPGTLDPGNACRACDPAVATVVWAPRTDGASCGPGKICDSQACTAECFIDGQLRVADALNPVNACQKCDPAATTAAWTALADGTTCGAGNVCLGQSCKPGCYIDGGLRPPNAPNPTNACLVCAPATSATAWTPLADGASCSSRRVCDGTICKIGCHIDGTFYADRAVNPSNACQQCDASASTSAWSARPNVLLLAGGSDVAAQGWSTVTVPTSSLTYGASYTQISTSTPNGSPSGGALLLYRPGAVEVGTPFTIEVVMSVERVNPHNPYDSAAAIMGSFGGGLGAGVDRQQMIYLDPAAIGWGDDSKSAPFAVQGTGYHTYRLSVSAAGDAQVSVDGVLKLTRAGFTPNGTIAIGDQTNDGNVESSLRIQSVARICP